MADQGDWRSEAFRRKVISQIEDAVRSSNTPMTKSSVEMENHVYHKAKSREEYLALVARLILHVKDFNNQRREKQAQQQQLQQAAMAGGMPQQMAATGGNMVPGAGAQGIQDPINALQNMAMSGGGMGPGQPGMLPGAAPQPMQTLQQQQQQQQRQQMIQQLQQQRLAGQQTRPQLQRQDAFIVTSSNNVQQIPPTQQAPTQNAAQQLSFASSGMGSMVRQSPFTSINSLGNQASPQINSNPPSQGAVPSPAQPSSQQPMGSPMSMMTSPSPQIVPSPTPRVNMSMGAPSPSTALNTPGNPGSVGAAPSPASQASEEQAYLDKLKQLSKYIEPLRRMIKKTEDGKESDHRKNDINKLKNLHDILSNPSKRVTMATLAKCEQVLEKIHFGPKISSSSTAASTAVTASHAPYVHMCQPLMDSVAAHITSPSFNHTLQKSFGPAMAAMFGNPIRAPSPPRKRRKVEDHIRIPDILQGEIARLDRRFKVKLDPIQHAESKDSHLICRLDDHCLPSVPPILVKIPHDYPDNSPECLTSRKDYDSTTFLRSIQQALVTHLVDLPSKFSFTSLLDMWEMSVRKACRPNS